MHTHCRIWRRRWASSRAGLLTASISSGRTTHIKQESREARLEALERVLVVAKEHEVHAILVAGDAFEDNQVDASMVERVANLLGDKAPAPVYLLPGNHDPYTRDINTACR